MIDILVSAAYLLTPKIDLDLRLNVLEITLRQAVRIQSVVNGHCYPVAFPEIQKPADLHLEGQMAYFVGNHRFTVNPLKPIFQFL